jgi:hypothetical protein
MRRFVLVCFATIVIGASCSTPTGPQRPARQDTLSGTEAVTQAAVRGAAIGFVDAYAGASQDDGDALRGSVTGTTLRRWVHWVVIQNREFPGSIVGSSSITGVGTAAPVTIPDLPDAADIIREVILFAQVDLAATPTQGDPVSLTRVLNGPMRLATDGGGNWRVTDFSRDGVPLSAVFQILEGVALRGSSGLTVVVDSFVAAPVWQFNLVVSTEGGPPVRLETSAATLVDRQGAQVAVAGEVTDSIREVGPGPPAEGIVTFEPRSSARGLFLRLEFTSATGAGPVLEVPLQGVIDPIAVAPASPSP